MVLPTSEYIMAKVKRWDDYFMKLCETVASKSPCLSRHIGAIIVRDHSIVSTGYNGPPRGVPHCGERILSEFPDDPLIKEELIIQDPNICPRKMLGFVSGDGLYLCPAAHAERNCISNAARNGVSVLSSTLYLNTVLPCKDCMASIINAGIHIIVCHSGEYDELALWMVKHSRIQVVRWEP